MGTDPAGPNSILVTPVNKSLTFTEEFKCRVDITKSFCDTAKTYVQLSTAALALPLVFVQTILGKNVSEAGLRTIPWPLKTSWLSFLLAIMFGMLYQWLAIRRVWDDLHSAVRTESRRNEPGIQVTRWIPQFRRLNRSYLYGGMLLCFFLGALFFVVFAWQRMHLAPSVEEPSGAWAPWF